MKTYDLALLGETPTARFHPLTPSPGREEPAQDAKLPGEGVGVSLAQEVFVKRIWDETDLLRSTDLTIRFLIQYAHVLR